MEKTLARLEARFEASIQQLKDREEVSEYREETWGGKREGGSGFNASFCFIKVMDMSLFCEYQSIM